MSASAESLSKYRLAACNRRLFAVVAAGVLFAKSAAPMSRSQEQRKASLVQLFKRARSAARVI
jgi:hypothetical protein